MTYCNKYNKELAYDDDYDGAEFDYTIYDHWRDNNLGTDFIFSDIYISDSIGYDYPFFFKRRNLHYKVINDLIFSQLILLKNNPDKSDLFDYLRLNTLNPLNKLIYEDAEKHLKKHNRYLPQKIEVPQKIENHNIEVKNLCQFVDSLIDNNFNYDDKFSYRFFPTHIKIQLKEIWFNSIKDIKDITNIIKINENINKKFWKSAIEYTGDDDTILNINSHAIGNGDYKNSAYELERCFLNLLKNEMICQKLTVLVNDNLLLNKDIEFIVNNVSDIYESIDKGYYNKILGCCPTIWKIIINR